MSVVNVKTVLYRFLKSQTLKVFSIFAGANMLSTIIFGVGGIIQSRWVEPEMLGLFSKYTIVSSYLVIFQIVVQDGLMRQYPYMIGKGRIEDALKIAATAKMWYVLVTIVFFVLFSVLSIMALIRTDYFAAVGWAAQIIISMAGSYGVYQQTIYRRSMEFKRLSYNGLIASVISFILLGAVKVLGYYGLAIKQIGYNGVRILLDAKYIPVRVRMAWDKDVFLDLAKISIPLSLEGYIRTSFMTATFGFLVVRYCGAKDLGLYGIAAAFEGFAMIFVTSLMQIFDVKMANKFGETDSLRKSIRSLTLPTVLGVLCSVVCAGGLCVTIGPFMRYIIPKYTEAISVVYVLSIGLPIGAMMMPIRLLRVALMYKSVYTVASARVITLMICTQIVPHSIEWFAGCKIFAEFLSVVVGYILLFWAMRKESLK